MRWLVAWNVVVTVCKVFITLSLTHNVMGCVFPVFMQSNTSSPDGEGKRIIRNWHSRIRDQNSESTLQLRIDGSVFETVSTDNTATSHTRVCLQMVGRNKYLVAHEEAGQTTNKYTCLQFLQRSSNVVQIRQAQLSNSMGKNLCQGNNMELQEWLVIDRNNVHEDSQPCPLVGGFSIQIYDKMNREGVCDAYKGQTRLESECSKGEGLYFYFRNRECVPRDLFMYKSQRTICLTNWRTGPYTFVLLKHNRDKFMWLLRYPTSQRESFSSVLLMDLVADMSSVVTDTNNYLRLDVVRDTARPAHALCLDDYEMCSHFDNPCMSPEMKLTCPRTCGICNETRPVTCNFQSKQQSQWYYSSNPGTLGLSINATQLTTYHEQKVENYHCIQWDQELPNEDPSTTTKMLVKEFHNGCRPRFSCVEFKQQTSSILFMKISEEYKWPFTQTPEDPLDCRHFAYEDDTSVSANPFKTKYLNLLYLRTSNTVTCDIPQDIANYKVNFNGGAQCTVSLVLNENQDGFSLELTNCPVSDMETSYACVDSSRMLPKRDQLVVTRSTSNIDAVQCWVFSRRQANVFYLLDAKDCNESIRKRLNKDRLKYVAVFSPTGHVPKISDRDKTISVSETRPTLTPKKDWEFPPSKDWDNIQRPSDTTDVSQNDDYRVLKNGRNSSANNNNNNKTVVAGDDSNSYEITATSVAVVGVVFTLAVIQSVCICKS